jgi:hypothetical protein
MSDSQCPIPWTSKLPACLAAGPLEPPENLAANAFAFSMASCTFIFDLRFSTFEFLLNLYSIQFHPFIQFHSISSIHSISFNLNSTLERIMTLEEKVTRQLDDYVSLHQRLHQKLQTQLAWDTPLSKERSTSGKENISLIAQMDRQKRMRLDYFQNVLLALKLKLACMAKTLALEDIVQDSTDQSCSIEGIQ